MNRKVFRLAALLAAVQVVSLATVAPVALAAATDKASAGLGFKGIGARVGLVDPEGGSSTVTLGAHIDAGEFVEHVHLTPYAEYWSVGVSGVADTKDFTVASDVTVDFPLQGGSLTPYAGGGLGLHFLRLPPSIPGDPTRTRLGLGIQGGIKNQVMPNFGFFGEVRWSFVKEADQLKLVGGFTYNFIY